MKKDRLLNPDIVAEIAALGHTEYLCISDCGLPIPEGVSIVDVSVTRMIPTFLQVLKSVETELVVESFILASEIVDNNPDTLKEIESLMGDKPGKMVSHEEFKKLTTNAKCIIRTGETTPYANIILVGGVNF